MRAQDDDFRDWDIEYGYQNEPKSNSYIPLRSDNSAPLIGVVMEGDTNGINWKAQNSITNIDVSTCLKHFSESYR